MKENSIDYIKHAHIRMKSGLEVLGVMCGIEDELVLHRPARIIYSEHGIRLIPMSIFSEQEFYAISYSDIEFQCSMNEDTKERFEEFWVEFSEQQMNREEVPKTLH